MPKPSKQPNPILAVALSVLPMAEIKNLSIKEACQRFADRATVSQRAFAEMGKLHHAISGSLKKGQTIYVELRKFGIKNSTISNASYASKVFDLVAAGHLTEAEFDTFTFADCYAICRATGDKSARRLTGPDVAVLVRAKPDNFDEELDSIFATGLTVDEAAAQAKKAGEEAAAAQKAAAEAAAKAAAEAAQKAAAEAAAAAATAAAASSNPPAPAATPDPSGSSETPAASAPAPAPSESASSAPAAAAAPESTPEPDNVVQMPADPDAALPEVLSSIDGMVEAVSGMSVEARTKVFAKLHEALEILSENLPGESAVA